MNRDQGARHGAHSAGLSRPAETVKRAPRAQSANVGRDQPPFFTEGAPNLHESLAITKSGISGFKSAVRTPFTNAKIRSRPNSSRPYSSRPNSGTPQYHPTPEFTKSEGDLSKWLAAPSYTSGRHYGTERAAEAPECSHNERIIQNMEQRYQSRSLVPSKSATNLPSATSFEDYQRTGRPPQRIGSAPIRSGSRTPSPYSAAPVHTATAPLKLNKSAMRPYSFSTSSPPSEFPASADYFSDRFSQARMMTSPVTPQSSFARPPMSPTSAGIRPSSTSNTVLKTGNHHTGRVPSARIHSARPTPTVPAGPAGSDALISFPGARIKSARPIVYNTGVSSASPSQQPLPLPSQLAQDPSPPETVTQPAQEASPPRRTTIETVCFAPEASYEIPLDLEESTAELPMAASSFEQSPERSIPFPLPETSEAPPPPETSEAPPPPEVNPSSKICHSQRRSGSKMNPSRRFSGTSLAPTSDSEDTHLLTEEQALQLYEHMMQTAQSCSVAAGEARGDLGGSEVEEGDDNGMTSEGLSAEEPGGAESEDSAWTSEAESDHFDIGVDDERRQKLARWEIRKQKVLREIESGLIALPPPRKKRRPHPQDDAHLRDVDARLRSLPHVVVHGVSELLQIDVAAALDRKGMHEEYGSTDGASDAISSRSELSTDEEGYRFDPEGLDKSSEDEDEAAEARHQQDQELQQQQQQQEQKQEHAQKVQNYLEELKQSVGDEVAIVVKGGGNGGRDRMMWLSNMKEIRRMSQKRQRTLKFRKAGRMFGLLSNLNRTGSNSDPHTPKGFEDDDESWRNVPNHAKALFRKVVTTVASYSNDKKAFAEGGQQGTAESKLEFKRMQMRVAQATTNNVLDLSHSGLRKSLMPHLIKCLNGNLHVVGLNLRGNNITDGALKELMAGIAGLEMLEMLDLSGNINLTARGIEDLVMLLDPTERDRLRAKQLEVPALLRPKPIFTNSSVNARMGAQAVSGSRNGSPTGRQRQVSSWKTHLDGHFRSSTVFGTVLKELHLEAVPLRDKGAITLCKLLLHNKVLQVLNVQKCNIQAKGAIAIAGFIENNGSLTKLLFGWNRILMGGAEGAMRIAFALRGHPGILHVDMSWNGMGDEVSANFGQMIMTNTTIKVMDLSGNGVGGGACLVLAEALRQNDVLEELHLNDNPIGEIGSSEVLLALTQNDTLQRLSLQRCSFLAQVGTKQHGKSKKNRAAFNRMKPSKTYRLDLSNSIDYQVANELVKLWHEYGAECWRYSALDGEEFEFSAEMNWPTRMPEQGHLEVTIFIQEVNRNTATLDNQDFGNILQELSVPTCTDDWRIAFLHACCKSFFFTSEQAVKVIGAFSFTKERVLAAVTLFPHLSNINMFSLVMERLNQQEQDLVRMDLGKLSLFNPENPTGNYKLQLGKPVDRMICKRMLEMAIKEGTWGPKATKQNLETWRNITLDGKKLSIPDPQKFDVPESGFFEFDYVSQKRAPSVAKLIRPKDMLKLLFEVETRQIAYSRKVESMQEKQRSAILFQQEQAKQAALRSLENTASASRDAASKSPPCGKKGKKAKKKGPEVIPEAHEAEQEEQDFIMPLVIQKDKEKFIENMAKKMAGFGDSSQLWIHSAVTYLCIHYASNYFFRSRQLIEILKRMDHGEQRVETVCMFYARVVDFSEFGEAIKILNHEDQIEVQQRLGWWNLYNEKSIDGLHFKLNVHSPEEMRVLARVCKAAHAHSQERCKRLEAGLKLKKTDVVHIITDMSINGHSVHVPEDDHMFSTITALANVRNLEGWIEFSIRLTKTSRDVSNDEKLTKGFSELELGVNS